MNIAVPRAQLRQDPVVVTRSDPHVGAEGAPDKDRLVVGSVTRGTWRELSPREQLTASQRGTISDSECVFELPSDVRLGDWIQVHGVEYEVVDMDRLRTFRRTLLRVTE